MGVKCSLLGHDYGEADVERERAEDGDEVVRTARRIERCHNCGHERTVSENTEVTSLEAAAGVVREPDGTVVAATENESDTAGEADGGVTIEDPAGETDTAEPPTAESELGKIDEVDGTDGGIDEMPRAGTDRDPGEWPSEPDSEGPANPERNEPSGLGTSGSLAAVSASTGEWPDESTTSTKTNRGVSSARNDDGGLPGNVFECPSCGFSAVVTDSSLRAGDICPDCGNGYLAWGTRKG